MFGENELREIPLSLNSGRKKVEEFLKTHELRFEEMEVYCAVFDPDDNIIAGGGLNRNVIKCIAVAEEARSGSVTNRIVSRLRQIAADNGYFHTKIFTKPKNIGIFHSLGYRLVGQGDHAVLMESNPRGISSYTGELAKFRREGRNGVIIMNCNPLTKGHEYLIERAASQVDNLYVIPLSESGSEFTQAERVGMLVALSRQMDNVTVCPTSEYVISSTTFPTYFLKEISSATDTQIRLDIDIFITHIAPALNCSVRFVGSEPFDALTKRYNELLAEILPAHGITLTEIPRFRLGPDTVSASALRRSIRELDGAKALRHASFHTLPYVMARLAAAALQSELDLTPKPGLVDRNNNGSHKDMDYQLMARSIKALIPGFTRFAIMGFSAGIPSHAEIVNVGLEVEKEMLEATGGINTHKGAVFALGIALIASTSLISERLPLSEDNLRQRITAIACRFPERRDTNGSLVREKYGIPGAVDYAASGYEELFSDWLPYYRQTGSAHELLIRIISTLHDTNMYHRGGAEGAEFGRREAAGLLGHCDEDSLLALDREFILRNLSPGGAADMYSLTIFLNSIINNLYN